MQSSTWRLGQIDTLGEDLVLSELRLQGASGTVDTGATLTSSHAPIAGALSNLIDGNPATTCSFAASDVRAPGFWIEWSLPADQEVRSFRATGTTLRRGALMIATGAFDAVVVNGVGYQEVVPFPRIDAHLSLAPVAAWTLDESGSTQTDLVGTNDATRTGGTIGATQMFLPDTIAFDPQTTGLARAAAGTFDTGAFSVVFDFKSTDFSNKVVIEHGAGNNGWTVQIPPGNTGRLQFLVGGVSNPVLTSAVISDGLAHRIVCTYSPTNGRAIYVDGAYDVATWLPSLAPSYGTSYIDMGSSGGTFGPAAGSALSNVAIFDRELTPREVRYLQGAPLNLIAIGVDGLSAFATSPTPAGGPAVFFSDATHAYRDFEFGGFGRIAGTVKKDAEPDIPLKRRVRLHREQDGLLVREVWSDPTTGAYSFDYIDATKQYTVIAYDYLHDYRAVIADNITPEAMP